MNKPLTDIKGRIEEYLALVTRLNDEDFKRNGYTFTTPPVAFATYGSRYAKVVTKDGTGHQTLHTFIDLTNGDILKAASWKTPAKNGVRGNLFSEDVGASVINHYGAIYLR